MRFILFLNVLLNTNYSYSKYFSSKKSDTKKMSDRENNLKMILNFLKLKSLKQATIRQIMSANPAFQHTEQKIRSLIKLRDKVTKTSQGKIKFNCSEINCV